MDSVVRPIPLTMLVMAAICTSTASTCFTTVIVAAGLSLGPNSFAGLPYFIYFLVLAASAFFTAQFAAIVGRKVALIAGQLLALAGAALSVWALKFESFWLLFLGAGLIGYGSGATTSHRLLVTELMPPTRAMQGISLLLGVGLVGGLLGPVIGTAGGLQKEGLIVPFASIGVASVLAVLFYSVLPSSGVIGRPAARPADRPQSASLKWNSSPVAAAFASAMAWAVMIALMGTGPVQMKSSGLSNQVIAFVMQAHFVMMFAPALLAASLRKLPTRLIFILALAALFLASLVAQFANSSSLYFVSLALVGIGWGLNGIVTTSIIAAKVPPENKLRIQGTLDLVIYGSAATSAIITGSLSANANWSIVSYVCIAAIVLYLAAFQFRAVSQ
jgi:MFS family permease